MTEEREPEWWDAWRGVVFANARILRVAEQSLQEETGLSLAFLDVLGRLSDTPDQRLRMQELQERSLFTRSGMTRLVDRVEAAGFVRRERVPGDRRGVAVVLTDEGRRAYEAGLAIHRRDVEREFASRLTERKQRAVAEALWEFWHDER